MYSLAGSHKKTTPRPISSGLPSRPQGNLAALGCQRLFGKELAFAWRVGPAGMNDVDANAMLRQFAGGGSGHLIVGRLGHVVGHRSGNRHVRVRAADHNHVAAVSRLDHLLRGGAKEDKTHPTC